MVTREFLMKQLYYFQISLGQIEKQNLNNVLKNYIKQIFSNVSLSFNENTLFINVEENPIININYNGIKTKLLELIKSDAIVKSRSSYNEYVITEEKDY